MVTYFGHYRLYDQLSLERSESSIYDGDADRLTHKRADGITDGNSDTSADGSTHANAVGCTDCVAVNSAVDYADPGTDGASFFGPDASAKALAVESADISTD
jgi:hypothetical protein